MSYTFEFKIIENNRKSILYTNNKFSISFEPSITIKQFIKTIADTVSRSYRSNFSVYNIEIVEAGQYNHVNGHNPGLAPCINSFNDTLEQKYSTTWKSTAFYVRYTENVYRISGSGGRL
jgi:hypothetical protein